MKVLGLGGSVHDYGACLVEDGEVVSMVEEERTTRVKQGFGLGPRLYRCTAADYVLESSGTKLDDVDFIASNTLINRVYTARFGDRIHWIGHHLAHAASTFFTCPYDECAVMVLDGRGSEVETTALPYVETATFYVGKGAELIPIRKQTSIAVMSDGVRSFLCEDSIGWFYESISRVIGFQSRTGFGEPGKTMGLAPYGGPKYLHVFAESYRCSAGEFRQSHGQLDSLRGYIRREMEIAADPFQVRADAAYALQYHFEKIVLALASWLREATGQRYLSIAGGVGLNSVVNQRIVDEVGFEDVYVVPATGDHGTSMGAALYVYYRESGAAPQSRIGQVLSPYLGKPYSDEEMGLALNAARDRVIWTRPERLSEAVASEIAQGRIVGWFQGRSEIGPRALGNRSILADPRQAGMKDKINSKVKHREAFRPFAPVVLEEFQDEYFTSRHPSYYMLFVPDVRVEKRHVIPAVTHVDGSARLQTTTESLNPQLCSLLRAFHAQTGVPVLLNTSFNDNNEPIVETPQDAVSTFLGTDIDILVLGDFVATKVG